MFAQHHQSSLEPLCGVSHLISWPLHGLPWQCLPPYYMYICTERVCIFFHWIYVYRYIVFHLNIIGIVDRCYIPPFLHLYMFIYRYQIFVCLFVFIPFNTEHLLLPCCINSVYYLIVLIIFIMGISLQIRCTFILRWSTVHHFNIFSQIKLFRGQLQYLEILLLIWLIIQLYFMSSESVMWYWVQWIVTCNYTFV